MSVVLKIEKAGLYVLQMEEEGNIFLIAPDMMVKVTDHLEKVKQLSQEVDPVSEVNTIRDYSMTKFPSEVFDIISYSSYMIEHLLSVINQIDKTSEPGFKSAMTLILYLTYIYRIKEIYEGRNSFEVLTDVLGIEPLTDEEMEDSLGESDEVNG